MLNTIYSLLSSGHRVIVQIVPYDEHEPRNRTLRIRLREEAELTREFYRSYLGFDSPELTIVNAAEQEIVHERLVEIQRVYARLYQNGDHATTALIDEHRRAWASPNILFVPKCIASIEMLDPDYLVCGEKHEIIAEGFSVLLNATSRSIRSFKFEDFKDLYLEAAMDRVDSVYTCIDVNDNEDFILHKLAMLRKLPGVKVAWLNHFVEHILDPAPERLKDGLGRALRSEAELEIAVTRFLANVRALIPYALDDSVELNLNWGTAFSSFTRNQKHQIARVAKQLYRDTGSTNITIQRLFGAGESGSLVLEIREHDDDNNRVSNVSVMKIGQEPEIRAEKLNYERFILPRKTAAFMAVKPGAAASVDGTAGIVYQDAQHYLGMSVKDRIETIAAAFTGVRFDVKAAQRALHETLENHLYEVLYKHGRKVEAGTVAGYLNEFLPADFRVEVDSYDRATETLTIASMPPVASTFQGEIDLTEVNHRQRTARGYAVDSGQKLDLTLGGDELVLSAVRPGRKMFVAGRIISSRREFYDSLYGRLTITRNVGDIAVTNGLTIPDPVARIDEVVAREYYEYVISPVHGDLHSGNVLYGHGKVGIIDYGKMRATAPSLYDAAFLCADLKSRYLYKNFDLATIDRLETALGRRSVPPRWAIRREVLSRLAIFEYDSLPSAIKSLGPPRLYYVLLMSIYLGRLKFDLPEHEKRVGLLLAHHAYLRSS